MLSKKGDHLSKVFAGELASLIRVEDFWTAIQGQGLLKTAYEKLLSPRAYR